MRRRQFLTASALSGMLSTAWPGRARAWLASAGSPAAADRLLAALERPASAAVIGRAYLVDHPRVADRDWLAAKLGADLRCRDCDPARADVARLRAGLSRQLRADFAESRVMRVDGRVLSVTKARLCAMAALTLA